MKCGLREEARITFAATALERASPLERRQGRARRQDQERRDRANLLKIEWHTYFEYNPKWQED